jgi:hypothetical protein
MLVSLNNAIALSDPNADNVLNMTVTLLSFLSLTISPNTSAIKLLQKPLILSEVAKANANAYACSSNGVTPINLANQFEVVFY